MDLMTKKISADPDFLVCIGLLWPLRSAQLCVPPQPGSHSAVGADPFPKDRAADQPDGARLLLSLVPCDTPQGTDPAPEPLWDKWVR